MALRITQVNIQHWDNNKYIFSCDLSNFNPDIILLNEIGKTKFNSLKLNGYKCICKSIDNHSGVVIFIRNNIQFNQIITPDPNTLAIKIMTTLGPLIIITAYIPPRTPTLPILHFNRLFNFNVPTIIAADLNAHHPFLHNTTQHTKQGDVKGKQLYHFAKNRNLTFWGPYFYTYKSGNRKGTPDVVLANKLANIFHTKIDSGNHIIADHTPINITLSTLPIKIVVKSKINVKSLKADQYKEDLNTIEFEKLHNKPVQAIDNNLKIIFDQIQLATANNCNKIKIVTTKSYQPSPKTKLKLKQYIAAVNNNQIYGCPSQNTLNLIRNQLITTITLEKTAIWDALVELAAQCYGEPAKFWKKVKTLLGNNNNPGVPLKPSNTNNNLNNPNQNSCFILDPQQQAQVMSEEWSKVFQPNTGSAYKNKNTAFIKQWYNDNKQHFKPDTIINHNKLIPLHPLLRPVENSEIKFAIDKLNNNKAPGISTITAKQIKFLPSNFIKAFIDIFDSIIASKYFPKLLLHIKMIFISKPDSDPSDPLNYRPICLIEVICKIFEHIINNRLTYFCEYNNLFSELQFGFRRGRSTQQIITMLYATTQENNRQRKTTLVSTRDISKAFDTVWHKGLTYKLHNITNNCMHFTGLIHYYLTHRTVVPVFNGKQGIPFKPKAGVPQGSVIGPILFNIYVNDIPPSRYFDTIRTQFADDVITMVRSDNSRKNENEQVQKKMQKELDIIYKWEKQWRIKVNVNKSKITTTQHRRTQLNNINIHIHNEPIHKTKIVKLLGYTTNLDKYSNPHITKITQHARTQLYKLYRFKSAPQKIKLQLYKTLIRPLLEYPSTPIDNTSITNMRKLQRIQNQATRFITNHKLSDKKRSRDLHNTLKLDPINVRINKLSCKHINKLHNKYYDDDVILNLGSTFEIQDPPIKQKKTSLAKTIYNNIFINNEQCHWNDAIEIADWVAPPPKYA